MKSRDHWFSEYAISHQNKTNPGIHYICVPAIFFSLVGLLMSIPGGSFKGLIPGNLHLIENWASFLLIFFVLVFYFRL